MNPTDFYKTAELLNNSSNEQSHIRTSIGRSYYGTFLFFRDYLFELGIKKTIKPRREIHAFVKDCFEWCQVPEGKAVADKLNDLMQKRHDADYNLNMVFASEDGSDTLLIAKRAIENYRRDITDEKQIQLLGNMRKRLASKWGIKHNP